MIAAVSELSISTSSLIAVIAIGIPGLISFAAS
jgi:hypothetical protein